MKSKNIFLSQPPEVITHVRPTQKKLKLMKKKSETDPYDLSLNVDNDRKPLVLIITKQNVVLNKIISKVKTSVNYVV